MVPLPRSWDLQLAVCEDDHAQQVPAVAESRYLRCPIPPLGVADGNLDDLQVNVSVDAVDVYGDHVVSDDDDSDACFEDEQED